MGTSSTDTEFDDFAAAAWPRLRRTAYLLTGDHHLAEDLAQTALVRTCSAWRRVRRDDAHAYARRTLVNLNIDRIRRRRVVEVGDGPLDALASRRDDGVDDRDEIVRLLAGLTDRERRVVVLRHYVDLGEAEVAAELGIAPGTVKGTLHRALGKLRVAIDDPAPMAHPPPPDHRRTVMTRTVEDLELALHGSDDPGHPDLAAIRGAGRRRRRRHAAAGGAAVLVVVGLLATGIQGIRGGDDRGIDQQPASRPSPTPTSLSPLATRALAEIPGATRISAWQVLLPAPGPGATDLYSSQVVPDDLIDAGPVDIGARRYTGVTTFGRNAFASWLHDGVLADEEAHTEGGGYQTGTTTSGVVVDTGSLELACVRPLPEWGSSDDGCRPAMLQRRGDAWIYEWGMGADGFLDDGEPLQLFTASKGSTGAGPTTWVGGVDGTDVASVDLVATDGSVTGGTVAAGTVVPGDTMFWGTLPGDLAQVVTRDADGDVLERHRVEPCSGGVDCEVR